jgi:hypothetical protein
MIEPKPKEDGASLLAWLTIAATILIFVVIYGLGFWNGRATAPIRTVAPPMEFTLIFQDATSTLVQPCGTDFADCLSRAYNAWNPPQVAATTSPTEDAPTVYPAIKEWMCDDDDGESGVVPWGETNS